MEPAALSCDLPVLVCILVRFREIWCEYDMYDKSGRDGLALASRRADVDVDIVADIC